VSPRDHTPSRLLFRSSEIITASLIRYGSATHGLNTDQRRIPLTPKKSKGQFTYQFSIAKDNGVVTPGYWMLFVLNSQGVPSVAKPMKVLIARSSTII
jgi:galactose oxidase